ncbi:AraC family transcriptional regulator [Siminovitchia terrae]|uniref:AraC family transcriptional regulator n=1 Tax=Siminovitchia terrae TaxID=1914933 RepID=A0ABQ4KVD0_SIMTE|nr:AraC family transcriptional regulator [Siminovitchia terrae]GIN93737.1 AraC family transcriptional regulator [Siminovitchia terrae]GIN95959.1 AraC family transcriptional regulator [Siminovitchia terrae]
MESLNSIYQRYFDESFFIQKNGISYMPQPEVATGSVYKLTTYSGIEIVYYDFRYHEPYPIVFASKGRMVELQFALSGQRHVIVSGQEHEFRVGHGSLTFMQDFKAWFYPPAHEQYVSLSLGIPVSLFNYAAQQLATSTNMTFDFDRVINGQTSHAIYFNMDARSRATVNHLMKNFQHVHRSPLIMEATALELLNMHMLQLFELTPRSHGLSKEDMRKLHLAKQVLESCMAAPPSLLALSKRIGLNDYKLKKGFKDCFGLTVFEYLRHIRLDHAMKLLQDQAANVTEAAMIVGYSNVSAFSEQFFRRYGMKPSEVKKQF